MSTIVEVAERAGVSRTTVSHVLNHADRVSPSLRQRVQKAIDELGYSPNPQARSLRTGRTNVVGMVIADIRNPFFTEMVKTAQSALEGAGLDTLIFNTDVPAHPLGNQGGEYLRQISRRRIDGLIVGDVALPGMHEALRRLDVPGVFVGYLPNRAIDSVRMDSDQGAWLMGRYLAGKGHRRVANVTGPHFFEDAMTRARGFERGLAEAGAPMAADLRFEGSYLQPSGRSAVQWLLETHGNALPSAVFFGNYLMAVGALAEFHDRGIRVPGDICVALFDDLPDFEYVRPRLTCVGVSPTALASRAATLLIGRLNGSLTGVPTTEVLPCSLREGDTA